VNQGYYIMGRYTSVAWFLSYVDAVNWSKQMRYRGGPDYTIVPVNPPIVGATDEVRQCTNSHH
jgi:hypothetical protein